MVRTEFPNITQGDHGWLAKVTGPSSIEQAGVTSSTNRIDNREHQLTSSVNTRTFPLVDSDGLIGETALSDEWLYGWPLRYGYENAVKRR
jgi:hypothetical protein